jgi:hypothetical protein
MRFGERIVVFVFRPIYRTFFDRLFWCFLAKVRVFFMADITARLDALEQRLQAENSQRWAAIEERLRSAETSNSAQNSVQWDALEQLLLALYRQPDSGALDLYRKRDTSEEPPVSNPTEFHRAHAANNLR